MRPHFLVLILILSANFNGKCQTNGFTKSTDGTAIFYRSFGSGAPLLIINGGPGMNSEGFADLAKKLSKNNMTIIYDQRGTGKSKLIKLDTTTITMKLMIDDIESIRRHLQIEKWSVLGHSFGGMLASYYAAQHPDRIEKMILSSSGGIDLELLNYVSESINSKLTKEQLNGVNYWANRISQGDTSHHARLERGKNLAHAYVIDKKFLPAIAERLTQGNQTVNILIWTSMQSIGFNCAEGLEKFNKPVLIIQGKQDIIKAETAEKAHRVLKNSKLVYLENCIHYGWLDCEKSYLEEIENLLDTEKR